MEYTIVNASTQGNLIGYVNQMLSGGWKPTGGVLIAFSEEDGQVFYQALVKG